MRINQSTRRGFTLIEILIVAATIGMLASIAVPNFVKARAASQRSICINNLRQLEGGVQQWAFENNKSSTEHVTLADAIPYLKGEIVCSAGGTTTANSYEVTDVQTPPTCKTSGGGSINGHFLPQ